MSDNAYRCFMGSYAFNTATVLSLALGLAVLFGRIRLT